MIPRPFWHHIYCESAPPSTRPDIAVRHRNQTSSRASPPRSSSCRRSTPAGARRPAPRRCPTTGSASATGSTRRPAMWWADALHEAGYIAAVPSARLLLPVVTAHAIHAVISQKATSFLWPRTCRIDPLSGQHDCSTSWTNRCDIHVLLRLSPRAPC